LLLYFPCFFKKYRENGEETKLKERKDKENMEEMQVE
jgi:hypothetical protein